MPNSNRPPFETSIDKLTADDPRIPLVQKLDSESFKQGERTNIEAECRRPFTHVWAAITNPTHTAVGFIATWHVTDELHILNIATAPRFRRLGIGSLLMTHAIDFANKHNASLVLLEVRSNNDEAIRLYRSFGFSAERLRIGYYSDGTDALEMMLSLNTQSVYTTPSA